jgi:hypothetical protein
LQNLHQLFDWQYIGQTSGGDFAKFCGLLRIYELYMYWILCCKPPSKRQMFLFLITKHAINCVLKKNLDLAEVIGNQNRVTVIQVLYVKTNKTT